MDSIQLLNRLGRSAKRKAIVDLIQGYANETDSAAIQELCDILTGVEATEAYISTGIVYMRDREKSPVVSAILKLPIAYDITLREFVQKFRKVHSNHEKVDILSQFEALGIDAAYLIKFVLRNKSTNPDELNYFLMLNPDFTKIGKQTITYAAKDPKLRDYFIELGWITSKSARTSMLLELINIETRDVSLIKQKLLRLKLTSAESEKMFMTCIRLNRSVHIEALWDSVVVPMGDVRLNTAVYMYRYNPSVQCLFVSKFSEEQWNQSRWGYSVLSFSVSTAIKARGWDETKKRLY